jgi:HEAT repeats/Putative zinc-finger
MSCDKIQEMFADYLTGDIDEESRRAVRDHIAGCGPCRMELEDLTAVWAKLGVLPEEQPSGALRGRFYAMLEDAKKEMEGAAQKVPGKRFLEGWRKWFTFRRPAFAASFSAFLLLLGTGTGWLLSGGMAAGRISSLRQEVRDMRETAALSLLEQTSASGRLQGISYSKGLDKPDNKTLGALVNALNSDPNPNVRLAAVEALYLFRNQPGVREGLVASLATQDSPLVQVALIDLLVEIREQRAAAALKALVQDKKLNPDVKKVAEEGLKLIV